MSESAVINPSDQDALRQISRIAGDDFCEDIAMRADELTGDLKTAAEKLLLIYTIAHSMDRSATCHHVHGDWRAQIVERDKAEEVERSLHK